MGWVTLTLRKTELKGTHSDYQKKLLDISREKRRMARQDHYEQLVVRNRQSVEQRAEYTAYTELRDNLSSQLKASGISQEERENIQNDMAKAQENYQFNINEIKTMYEEELRILEDEAADIETSLDQQQVEIEAQLEAISAEIEAVGEAVSSQIQASTIKLS